MALGARAAGGQVSVEGGRELRKALKEAGEDLEYMKSVHAIASATVALAAQSEVPVRSGALRDTIRSGATQRAATVRAGKKRVPYANCVHWGRMVWPSKEATPAPPRSPHPAFMYPRLFITRAAQTTETQWVEEYMKHLNTIIDNIEGATP